MVDSLIAQLLELPEVSGIVLTQNLPEDCRYLEHPKLRLIKNPSPKGFGANHNQAFRYCAEPYFCVLNPDIEFEDNPFPGLLRCLQEKNAVLAAPLVLNPEGRPEDSIRHFPTFTGLARKLLGGSDGRYVVEYGQSPFYPDWVAGMFMLFSADAYARLQGFDERYFLYYEDVDICTRLWKEGLRVVACPSTSVVHDARRASHRDMQHMRWHVASMLRYLWKYSGRLPVVDSYAR